MFPPCRTTCYTVAYLRNQGGGGCSVTRDVQSSIRDVPIGGSSSDHLDSQTYTGAPKCQSKLPEPQGSDTQD